ASAAVARAQPCRPEPRRASPRRVRPQLHRPAHLRAPSLLREGDVALLKATRPRVALLIALLCATATHAQTQATEVSLKSAFLYKFIHYADWPDRTFAAGQDPIAICVVEQQAFAHALENA